MKIKTLALAIAMATTSQAAISGEIFNGKLMAMSGAGVAGADFRNGATLNPALVGHYEADDDFGLNLNVGVLASDEDELIDNSDDLSEAIDALEGIIPNSEEEINDVIRLLEATDNATVRVDAGSHLQISIPNKIASATLFASGTLQLGVATDVKQADIDYLKAAATNHTIIDTDQLDTEIFAVGAVVKEFGVSLAKPFKIAGRDVLIGISPKIQQVETIEYSTRAADYDSDDFDSEQYTKDGSNFNLDVGAHFTKGTNLMFGAVLKNILKQEYSTVTNRDLLIEPQLTIGAAYTNSWLLAEIDIDINAVEDLVLTENKQLIRFGAEFDAFGWAQLRFGYRHDLKSTLEDAVSAGIGISPFGVANIDIAAVMGDDDTFGAAIQLGLNF